MRPRFELAFLLGFSVLTGCSFGLTPEIDTTLFSTGSGEHDLDGEAESLDSTDVSLAGRVFRIEPDTMTITEPPGLDALKSKAFERDILVYVESESASKLGLSVALADDAGEQDPCETVRAFPNADWSENPVFEAGPGEIDASFGGQPATLRHVSFSGVFDADGSRWRDGTLVAQLDGRELDGALGDIDVCELVDAMGGACTSCDDGKKLCFAVAINNITATEADIDFDPRNDNNRCQ